MTESLKGTQNASGCDSQGKTKGLMPASLRGKASSHLQMREGKLLESPDLEKTIGTMSSMSIRILRRSYCHS